MLELPFSDYNYPSTQMPYATFINALAVLLGGTLGLLLGQRFPEKIKSITFQAIGLFTLVLGMNMALKGEEMLFMVFSLILGGITGEGLKLEARTNSLGNKLREYINIKNERFSEGLTTSFLIFCVGSMTILGAIEEGINRDPTLILTKSVLDGFTAIALAAVYGSGVLFVVIPLIIFQGGITVMAAQAQHLFQPYLIQEMGAVGGVMIVGLGLNLLEIKKIQILNLLPALLYIVLMLLLKPYLPL